MGLVAPVYYGWVFDTTGSYNNAFLTVLILAGIAASITLLVRIPRKPSGATEESSW